ncbi:hypothetical protein [Brevibacillus sp. H7]|uniref:hypothetical protein n=1 Tax=Brevibacillus sp. H7 TaxID=3349138 RepID=UPI0038166D5B
MELILQLVKDYWPIAACILLAVVVFQVMFRSLLRLLSLFVILGTVLVLFFQFSPEQVIQLGRSMVQGTQDAVNQTITPILEAELKDASCDFREDGSYEIRTASLRIVGKKGESKATVYYKDSQFEVDVGMLENFLQDRLPQGGVTKPTL